AGMYFLWISLVMGVWSGIDYHVKVIRQVVAKRTTPNPRLSAAGGQMEARGCLFSQKRFSMQVLVTGVAGFIGFHVARHLLERGDTVVGIDNLNPYFEVRLKRELLGFFYILKSCPQTQVQHLVYASSSSVYGANTKMPFSIHDNVDHPVSLYAASKKANELMAHTYSHLYTLPTTGLRFFTVYGPWGRPDMALFLFTKAILSGQPIEVFNEGKMRRDFTYIDDVVEGVLRVTDTIARPNA